MLGRFLPILAVLILIWSCTPSPKYTVGRTGTGGSGGTSGSVVGPKEKPGGTNAPYEQFGKRYVPEEKPPTGKKFHGMASYYGYNDDTHGKPTHPGWNGGWIVVNAPELSRPALMNAIRAGNFYASTGPDFHSITNDEGIVTIQTSPVQFARLVGPGHRGKRIGNFDGELFTKVAFDIPSDWDYVYLEIEDDKGKRAWTNTVFL